MRKNKYYLLLIAFSLVILGSCEKNKTKFYEDDENKDLAVFSDKGYNIMSCLIDGVSVKTRNREVVYLSANPYKYEVYFEKKTVDSTGNDIFSIEWVGIDVGVNLVLEKDTDILKLGALNGKRLELDGTTGYFLHKSTTGNGYIYFSDLSIVKEGDAYSGHISGLFEATVAGVKIKKGRFDHIFGSGYSGQGNFLIW